MTTTSRTRISAKTILAVTGTLIVGIVLGVLGTNMVYQQRIAEYYRMRTPDGFVERLESVIQPTSEQQRAQIRPVLQHSAARMDDISRHSHNLRFAVVDSMEATLQPVLTPAQAGRCRKWVSNFHSHRERREKSRQSETSRAE